MNHESQSSEILQRLAIMETTLATSVTSLGRVHDEQVKQGNRLERIETIMDGIGPRCGSHSRRLGQLEKSAVTLGDIPKRVRGLEEALGKRGFMTAVIGAVSTATVLGIKWIMGAGGK